MARTTTQTNGKKLWWIAPLCLIGGIVAGVSGQRMSMTKDIQTNTVANERQEGCLVNHKAMIDRNVLSIQGNAKDIERERDLAANNMAHISQQLDEIKGMLRRQP